MVEFKQLGTHVVDTAGGVVVGALAAGLFLYWIGADPATLYACQANENQELIMASYCFCLDVACKVALPIFVTIGGAAGLINGVTKNGPAQQTYRP